MAIVVHAACATMWYVTDMRAFIAALPLVAALPFVVAACATPAVAPPTTSTPVDATPEETMPSADAAITATLIVDGSALVAGGPLLVRQQVTNPTTSPVKFSKYHTLFEGLRNNIFTITTDAGVEVAYQGVMAKRAPPGPKDFITLAPNETALSEPVDIGAAYPLPAGRLTIQFPGNAVSGLPASAPVVVDVKAAP